MVRGSQLIVIVALAAGVTVGAAETLRMSPQQPAAAPPPNPNGWQLPPDAADKKNPLTVDDKLVAEGKKVFTDKCQRCHGPGGLGDGPDADPDSREDMDLTNPKRAARNSDGVIFYKVSNGRKRPKMPAFREELNENQIWAVVAYAQSLRRR